MPLCSDDEAWLHQFCTFLAWLLWKKSRSREFVLLLLFWFREPIWWDNNSLQPFICSWSESPISCNLLFLDLLQSKGSWSRDGWSSPTSILVLFPGDGPDGSAFCSKRCFIRGRKAFHKPKFYMLIKKKDLHLYTHKKFSWLGTGGLVIEKWCSDSFLIISEDWLRGCLISVVHGLEMVCFLKIGRLDVYFYWILQDGIAMDKRYRPKENFW